MMESYTEGLDLPVRPYRRMESNRKNSDPRQKKGVPQGTPFIDQAYYSVLGNNLYPISEQIALNVIFREEQPPGILFRITLCLVIEER